MNNISEAVNERTTAVRDIQPYPYTKESAVFDSSENEFRKSAALSNRARLSDEQLIRLFAENGDEGSFNEIVSRYRDKIFRVALKTVNNASDAEDIVQEVFLALYNKAKTFKGESKFSTWLYRLSMNEVISKLRRRKREKAVFVSDYLPRFDDEERHLDRPVADWSQEVDKLVENKEICRIIEQAVKELSPMDKAVVVLSEYEELTNPEIGEALGLSVLAVKARLHRSRLFLRGKLAVYFGHSSD